MAKTLSFDFEGEHYTLEYTRRTVKEMEDEGFTISAIRNKPLTMFPMLFRGAFKCHHKRVKKETVDLIYKRFTNKEELVEKLVEMYNEALDSLFEEPEENEKNVRWKTNF